MDADNRNAGDLPGDRGRLNGWKEISAFLGKGVRTAQRWEHVFGMPVHRLGHKGGEIVFAYRDELTEWLRTTETDTGRLEEDGNEAIKPIPAAAQAVGPPNAGGAQAPRAVSRRRLVFAAVAVLGVLVVASAVAGLRGRAGRPSAPVDTTLRQPSSWRTNANRLQTFDASGALVWEHQFDFELNPPSPTPDAFGRQPLHVLIRDLDGDGAVETLLTGLPKRRADRELYCWNSDGSVRFVDRVDGSVTFGDTVFAPPWLGYQLFGTASPDGTTHVWSAVIHGLWFPTRLRQLDPQGQLVSEYWSNGYIESVSESVWQGQRTLFVGGTNNESRGMSLAIFDAEQVTGSAPASDPRFVCRTCPAGGPRVFLVFPQSCIGAASNDQGFAYEAWPEGNALLRVLTRHVFTYPQPDRAIAVADVIYTLDRDYRIVSFETTNGFRALHAQLEQLGLLDHPFGPADEHPLSQVKRWDGTAFEQVDWAPGRSRHVPYSATNSRPTALGIKPRSAASPRKRRTPVRPRSP